MKYFHIISIKVARAFQYRSEILTWQLVNTIPFFVLLFAWKSMFVGSATLRGYTLQQLVEYYTLVFIISSISNANFAEWRAGQIKNGQIDHFMVRPFSFLSEIFISEVAGKIYYIVLLIPNLILLMILSQTMLHISLLNIQATELLLLICSLCTTYLFNFMIASWIAAAAFWLESAQGLTHFQSLASAMLTGALFPLAFMPHWLAQLINWLPFKYLYAVPIGIFQNTYTVTPFDILYMGVTLIAMWMFTQFIWKKALYQYASGGG